MTDGLWVINSQVDYLLVGGACNNHALWAGMSFFAVNSTISSADWNVENLPTDALWFNNTQLAYPYAGGRCEKVLKVGMSCFDADIAASGTDWSIGAFILQMDFIL